MYFDEKKPSRRAMLLAGAAAGTTAALGAAGVLGADRASAAAAAPGSSWLPYPADVTDTSHCTPEVAEIFRGFFSAKSEHNAAELMSYFAKPNGRYLDASLGSNLANWAEMNAFFTPLFATAPAAALSYPLRIVTSLLSYSAYHFLVGLAAEAPL